MDGFFFFQVVFLEVYLRNRCVVALAVFIQSLWEYVYVETLKSYSFLYAVKNLL